MGSSRTKSEPLPAARGFRRPFLVLIEAARIESETSVAKFHDLFPLAMGLMFKLSEGARRNAASIAGTKGSTSVPWP